MPHVYLASLYDICQNLCKKFPKITSEEEIERFALKLSEELTLKWSKFMLNLDFSMLETKIIKFLSKLAKFKFKILKFSNWKQNWQTLNDFCCSKVKIW